MICEKCRKGRMKPVIKDKFHDFTKKTMFRCDFCGYTEYHYCCPMKDGG